MNSSKSIIPFPVKREVIAVCYGNFSTVNGCINVTTWFISLCRGRRVHDRMVVGFITTYAIRAYHH